MISKREFEVLEFLLTSPNIDQQKYALELASLRLDKLIYFNVVKETKKAYIYEGFIVTPKGKRAYEEYLSFLDTQSHEAETLKVAKEANEISKQANTLSEKANDIATESKTLSKWAIGVSIFAAVIAIVDIIVGVCT